MVVSYFHYLFFLSVSNSNSGNGSTSTKRSPSTITTRSSTETVRVTACPVVTRAASMIYMKLEEARDQLEFISYTSTERTTIGTLIESMMDIYLNREIKIADFGDDFPIYDPIVRATDLSVKAASITDEAIHFGVVSLFARSTFYLKATRALSIF